MVSARRDRLPDVETLRATHALALEQLGQEPDQPGDEVSQWLDRAEQIVARIKQGIVDDLAGIDSVPASVDAWIAARREEAASHAALEKSDDQAKVRRAVAELDARHELGERREEILERLRRMREVERLGLAKAKTGTAAASKKMTALSRELVEADLQGALTRQLKALDFRGLEVVPKTRTKSGTPMMGLKFKTVDGPRSRWLSQASSGGFRWRCSSPDDSSPTRCHLCMSLSARRLPGLRSPSSTSCGSAIRLAMSARVCLGRGWLSRKRIAPLREKLGSVREAYESGDPDVYTGPVIEFCALLRGAFERTVEDRVFAGVITRREDSIHTKKLDRVHCTEEICELVDRGMDENSPCMTARLAMGLSCQRSMS